MGTCLPGSPDRPEGYKLYDLYGYFEVPLSGCQPSDLVLTMFKREDEWRGESTATYLGGGLTDIVCDDVVCLLDARIDGDNFIVDFEPYEAEGGGHIIFTDGCGACVVEQPVGAGSSTWSGVKLRY